jgi:predicted nucleic acid-binding protein
VIVIADTSLLYYLAPVDAIDVLPKLFNRVIIPTEVQAELLHQNAPPLVRYWVTGRPSWPEVVRVEWASALPIPELDAGEEAAIVLAGQLGKTAIGVLRSASVKGLLLL